MGSNSDSGFDRRSDAVVPKPLPAPAMAQALSGSLVTVCAYDSPERVMASQDAKGQPAKSGEVSLILHATYSGPDLAGFGHGRKHLLAGAY